jgi:heme exporter protein B
MEFLRQTMVIAEKDLRLEFRTRERVVTMFTFAVLVAIVFGFSLSPAVEVTILFAGMLGLGRSFSLEREQDVLVGILLTPIDRGALYMGKFLANLVLLLGTSVVIYLAYGFFFQVPVMGAGVGLALVTFLASVGFMALGTLFSAIAGGTRLGDMLIPIVLLPLLTPLVIFGASATQRLILNRPLSEVVGNLRVLAAFDLIFLLVCTVIFASVVEE